MKIDKSKLKIKYLYDLYKLSPIYPTEEDVLYQYINLLSDNNKLDNFNSVDLKRLNVKLPVNYDIFEIMNVFIEQGYFKETNRYKKTNTLLIEYTTIKHPWL